MPFHVNMCLFCGRVDSLRLFTIVEDRSQLVSFLHLRFVVFMVKRSFGHRGNRSQRVFSVVLVSVAMLSLLDFFRRRFRKVFHESIVSGFEMRADFDSALLHYSPTIVICLLVSMFLHQPECFFSCVGFAKDIFV